MNAPFFKLTQIQEGWQAVFAFQVFHRPAEEWLKMRWGFNAGVLLDEALDRHKLFLESQAVNDSSFYAGTIPNTMLALRGIRTLGSGLQMAVLGKLSAPGREQAQQAAQRYAREIFSTFPYDFFLKPAETEDAYHLLSGKHLLAKNSNAVQILRGIIPITTAHGPRHLIGLWQASSRSNEQIWRALSAMPQEALFNVAIQPSALYAGEKSALLDIKKDISNSKQNNETNSAYIPWAEKYIERRLTAWKKFFLVQIHLVVDGEAENLIRSIGSTLTRDSNDLALPGYQTAHPETPIENQQWRDDIHSMKMNPNSSNMNDLADLDEAFSVFRFPYRPEAGLPGADFVELKKEPGPT